MPAEATRPRRVHPRVGGETLCEPLDALHVGGPSPRGRGNPTTVDQETRPTWSIPAWAGKPRWSRTPPNMTRVHPRVGGETRSESGPLTKSRGPSPRGRGNRRRRRDDHELYGSIPAWAGKPWPSGTAASACGVHPRVGGETQGLRGTRDTVSGPSPRGRGNLGLVQTDDRKDRSIPAWAGKPAPTPPVPQCDWVHPRVGGETAAFLLNWASILGPSPRGRGNRTREPFQHAI